MRKIVRDVANRPDNAQASVMELGEVADVLYGSAYNHDRTLTANGAEPCERSPVTALKTLSEDMPGAASILPIASNNAAEHLVADLKRLIKILSSLKAT